MLTITNSKIAGLRAEFKKFRGFSCLFDNPTDESQAIKLYTSLEEALQEIGSRSMANSYLFCPLPFHSYHVTVWDGVNDGNLEAAAPAHQEYFRSFLSHLASSLQLDSPFAEWIEANPLTTENNWGIRFKFKKLSIWTGGQVLVAQLEAADDDSRARLAQLEKVRAALYEKFEAELGISMYRPYAPHVSLGYFANEEGTLRALTEIDPWNALFEKALERDSIQFDSISLYGFTDMTNFFKRAPGMSYSASNPNDLKVIKRLMGMHIFYRAMPDFYGYSVDKQTNHKKTINERTIEKMRNGAYAVDHDQESIKKLQESHFTSLILKLSESEGAALFQPVRAAYKEIIELIKKYSPSTQAEVYLDSSHLTIRSILNYKKQSHADLERYKSVLYPVVKKWLNRFSDDTVLYAKGLHASLNSFKGLSVGIKIYPSTPMLQVLRGAAGVALYNAQDAGLLKPEELVEESKSAQWHTKLTHSTGLRVRDSGFSPQWTPGPIPEREKAFIDAFEALIERYEKVVFGNISGIQLSDIFIRNGRSDKLVVGGGAGIEIPLG